MATKPTPKAPRKTARQRAEEEVGRRERMVQKYHDQHVAAVQAVKDLEATIEYEQKRLTYAKAHPALADTPLPSS